MNQQWNPQDIALHPTGASVLAFLKGENQNGVPLYTYLLVPVAEISRFMRAARRTGFNPEKFGQVVRSGMGQPSSFLHQEILGAITMAMRSRMSPQETCNNCITTLQM